MPQQETRRRMLGKFALAFAADPNAALASAAVLIGRGPKDAAQTYMGIIAAKAAASEAMFGYDPLGEAHRTSIQKIDGRLSQIQLEQTINKSLDAASYAAPILLAPTAPTRALTTALEIARFTAGCSTLPTRDLSEHAPRVELYNNTDPVIKVDNIPVTPLEPIYGPPLSAIAMEEGYGTLAHANFDFAQLKYSTLESHRSVYREGAALMGLFSSQSSSWTKKNGKGDSIDSHRLDPAYVDLSLRIPPRMLEGRRKQVLDRASFMTPEIRKQLETNVLNRKKATMDINKEFLTNMTSTLPGVTDKEKKDNSVKIYDLLEEIYDADAIPQSILQDPTKNATYQMFRTLSRIGIDITNNKALLILRNPSRQLPGYEYQSHFTRLLASFPTGALKDYVNSLEPMEQAYANYFMSHIDMGERADQVVDFLINQPIDLNTSAGNINAAAAKENLQSVIDALTWLTNQDPEKAAMTYANFTQGDRQIIRDELFHQHDWNKKQDEFIMTKWINKMFMPVTNGQIMQDGQLKKEVVGYDPTCEPKMRLVLQDILTDARNDTTANGNSGVVHLSKILSNYVREKSEGNLQDVQALWKLITDIERTTSGSPNTVSQLTLAVSAYQSMSALDMGILLDPPTALNAMKVFMGAVSMISELDPTLQKGYFKDYHLDAFRKAIDTSIQKGTVTLTIAGTNFTLTTQPNIFNLKRAFEKYSPDAILKLLNLMDTTDTYDQATTEKLQYYAQFKASKLGFSPLPLLMLKAFQDRLELDNSVNPMYIGAPASLLKAFGLNISKHWTEPWNKMIADKDAMVKSHAEKNSGFTVNETQQIVNINAIENALKNRTSLKADQKAFITNNLPGQNGIVLMNKIALLAQENFGLQASLFTDGVPQEVASMMVDQLPQDKNTLSRLYMTLSLYNWLVRENPLKNFKLPAPEMSGLHLWLKGGLFDKVDDKSQLFSQQLAQLTPAQIVQSIKNTIGIENSTPAVLAERYTRDIAAPLTKQPLTFGLKSAAFPKAIDPVVLTSDKQREMRFSDMFDATDATIVITEIGQQFAKAKLVNNGVKSKLASGTSDDPNAVAYRSLAQQIVNGQEFIIKDFDPAKWGTNTYSLQPTVVNGQEYLPWGVIFASEIFRSETGIDFKMKILKNAAIDLRIPTSDPNKFTNAILNPPPPDPQSNSKPTGITEFTTEEFIGTRIFLDEKTSEYWFEGTITNQKVQMKVSDFLGKGIAPDEFKTLSNNQKVLIEVAAAVASVIVLRGFYLAGEAAISARIAAIAAKFKWVEPILMRLGDLIEFILTAVKLIYLNETDQRDITAWLQQMGIATGDLQKLPPEQLAQILQQHFQEMGADITSLQLPPALAQLVNPSALPLVA